MVNPDDSRTMTSGENTAPPPLGPLLTFAAVVPIAAGSAFLWIGDPAQSYITVSMTLLWSAAILAFLAGVRHAVSFRHPGGTTIAQGGTMLWLYGLGFATIVETVWAYTLTATTLAILGFLSLAILDPIAAKRGEAPLFFASLRSVQMAIPIVALVALGVYVWLSPLFA
ncbi:DUF3429 domain-containing protein [Jiella sp. MQZ9-1]|uniref:DUF3429 domain-containing protein n=1 Tax=Jiella flava TaxID=2816857 RepID=A0A939FUJ9_9HYPH|nr:DUF3429 domain-containing protein [Jiella flava]MBO0661089.1 DUF3429 domain-containing protein [Jiella flava]MCD2469736.1 DUF3429 domain-containing protein [Jiella flava]